MSHTMGEGCRELTSPAPLRTGEKACLWCGGYGANPAPRDAAGITYFNPIPCYECGGSGKTPARNPKENDW